MQLISDLELPFLALNEPEFAANPASYFATARQMHPWLAKGPFAFVLTQHAAIRELMLQDDKMVVGYSQAVDLLGATGTPWGDFIQHAVQNQSGPLHKRLRDILAPAFTPREASRHRGLMRDVMRDLLDQWTPEQAFDFEYFASYYPITVMCQIIGASPDVVPRLRSSLEILGVGGSFDESFLPQFQSAFIVVDAFVRELVAERRAGMRPREEPDLLDRLLSINGEGELSDEELYNLLVFLFTAGYDTSKNVLTLVMHLLIDRPEMYERCGVDPEFCRKIVNETFRFHGVSSSPRQVMEDIVFRDILIPKDTMLFLPWSVSGRDPDAFPDPDIFDPERPRQNTQIPFGLGPHMCLGQFIARAQLEEGLHLIAQRIKSPKRTGEIQWRVFPGVWGMRGLPIEFDL